MTKESYLNADILYVLGRNQKIKKRISNPVKENINVFHQ